MSLEDKIQNSAEDLGGKAKELAGDVSGDKDLKAEGKARKSKTKFPNLLIKLKTWPKKPALT